MEFEFLEFSLVSSHWMVFSARFLYKSHPSFSSFCKNPLGTWFLRESWFGNLNHHREALSPFLYVMMSVLGNEILKALKVSPKRFIRVMLKLHDVFLNECGLMDWVDFFLKILKKIIP